MQLAKRHQERLRRKAQSGFSFSGDLRMAPGRTLLMPAELAQRWKCSASLIRKMIAAGELPALRIGAKMLRVDLAEIERYETAQLTTRRIEIRDRT